MTNKVWLVKHTFITVFGSCVDSMASIHRSKNVPLQKVLSPFHKNIGLKNENNCEKETKLAMMKLIKNFCLTLKYARIDTLL